MNDERNNKSPQILNSASNFLGFCFLVITSLKFFKLSGKTFVDEITAVCFVIFMFSCLCSFLSIRSKNVKRSVLYETVAEYSFLSGLIIIFLMTIFFMLEIIH
jgi:hypothetical protein